MASELASKDYIEIMAYQSEWQSLAKSELTALKVMLKFPWIVDLQHIGSTSVPALAAKPIIDIAIGVTDLEAAKSLIPNILQAHNYLFWDENPDLTKLFLVKGMPPFGAGRTHHIHVMHIHHHDWLVRPLFRDYLIMHSKVKQAYAELKRRLAAQFQEDRVAYTQAKTKFIQPVNAKAILPYVQFKPLVQSDFNLLLDWFNTSHVQAFYSLRDWSLQEVRAKYMPRLQNNSVVKCFIITLKNIPIGYIQTYAHQCREGIGVDFFLGNSSFIRRGLSSAILNQFIATMLADNSILVVDPDVRNHAAIALFMQSGFTPSKIIETKNELGQAVRLQEMVKKGEAS